MFQIAIIIVLLSSVLFFGTKYFILRKNHKKLSIDVAKIALAIKRVRYGDLYLRICNLNDKNLEKSMNTLIESMYDREMMIKEYQATLSKKNLSLEEVLKQEKQLQTLKEDFAATLTHDMKVPVIAELNSLNYLISGRLGSINDKQLELLHLMRDSNEELKELIENMLETYKLDNNNIVLSKAEYVLNKFIQKVVKEMEQNALSTNHNLVLDIDATNDLLYTFDLFQLQRVIKNLIQNAISFSPHGSDIVVKTVLEKDNFKLSITNKGQGISPDDLKLIFQKYYTGHSKFRKAGTGLGLYISYQIALAHKGNIDVDCTKQDYTTFILTLPIPYQD